MQLAIAGDTYHTWGYKAAKVVNNEIVVEDIGHPEIVRGGFNVQPVWNENNQYGMQEGTLIQFDGNRNIVDPNGNILIPYPKGLSGNETFYGPNDQMERKIEISENEVGKGVIIDTKQVILDNTTTGKTEDIRKEHKKINDEIIKANK